DPPALLVSTADPALTVSEETPLVQLCVPPMTSVPVPPFVNGPLPPVAPAKVRLPVLTFTPPPPLLTVTFRAVENEAVVARMPPPKVTLPAPPRLLSAETLSVPPL